MGKRRGLTQARSREDKSKGNKNEESSKRWNKCNTHVSLKPPFFIGKNYNLWVKKIKIF